MEAKKIGDNTVNDGKGLFDNEGLIDSLIIDCNNAVKQITSGNYISWCGIMVQMVQKLGNLKKGIQNDLQSRDDQIEEMRQLLEMRAKTIDSLVKKDGEEYGND